MVIIEGTFPLDEINSNGWGLRSSDADNAISSLKTSVIRVCPRDSPHGCDLSEDPNAEIGTVIGAWKEPEQIRIRADITDSVASKKLEDGTWPKKWSPYALAPSLEGGWAKDIEFRSLTLVTNPAWENATFQIAASGDGKIGIRALESFTLTASQKGDPLPNNDNNPPAEGDPSPEEKIAQLEQDIADKDTKIGDLEKSNSDLTAANEELDRKVKDMEKLTASLKDEKTKMITLDEAKKLVAAELDNYKEDLAKTSAIEKLTAARKELDLETKAEDYQHLTAADIDKLAAEYGGIKLTAAAGVQYPAGDSGNSRIGVFNPVSGVYE